MPDSMAQKNENSEKHRANITLLDDDVILIEQLRIAVEKRLDIKVPRAFIVKLALRSLADIELT